MGLPAISLTKTLLGHDRINSIASSAVSTSSNCYMNVSRVARCSFSERAAVPSEIITVLYSSIIASRAVASQQTSVLVPVKSRLRMPHSSSVSVRPEGPLTSALYQFLKRVTSPGPGVNSCLNKVPGLPGFRLARVFARTSSVTK